MVKQEENRFKVKGKLGVVNGSILTPHNAGLRFVLTLDNMLGKTEGAWYSLFDRKWKKVRETTKGWYANKTGARKLGAIVESAVQSDVWVIHMLCQDEKFKTDLAALETCLKEVCKKAIYEKASVHVSSLLVEAVPELKDLAIKCLIDSGVSLSFYNEPG